MRLEKGGNTQLEIIVTRVLRVVRAWVDEYRPNHPFNDTDQPVNPILAFLVRLFLSTPGPSGGYEAPPRLDSHIIA